MDILMYVLALLGIVLAVLFVGALVVDMLRSVKLDGWDCLVLFVVFILFLILVG